MKTHRIIAVIALLSVILFSAWAVQSQTSSTQYQPTDFNTSNPDEYPLTNVINVLIKGLGDYGTIYMLEGIESSSYGEKTSYPPLVLHGVFSKIMRDWRTAVIAGTVTKRDIQLDLMNKAGKRVLRITFYNAYPVSFAFPPLSVDSNTRYMERVEFLYTYFDITN